MKKIKILLFFLMTIITPSFAIEEVTLPEETQGLDYLSDVYYGKIENEKEVSPILRLFSEKGYTFENSKVNSVKLHFLYSGQLNYSKYSQNSPYFNHSFFAVEPMMSVNFNENKSKAMFDINLTRHIPGYSNGFTQRISQAYVSHKITDNQTIMIGQGPRLPNTYDGSRSLFFQEMFYKSQLGRTFGEALSVGVRNLASYKYMDYDIGLYDSTRYMKDFGNGLDFTGHVMFKPFANVSEKTGNFKIGGSYAIGKNKNSYNTYSIVGMYDYNKFHIQAEYANADGYNGVNESQNKADGFYTLLSYNLTPKLSLLARYDYFTPNKDISHIYTQEYSAGVSYYLFKNMKLMLNYVNRHGSNNKDANMILFATRFIL